VIFGKEVQPEQFRAPVYQNFRRHFRTGEVSLDPEPCYSYWNNPKRPKPRLVLTLAFQMLLNMISIIPVDNDLQFQALFRVFANYDLRSV